VQLAAEYGEEVGVRRQASGFRFQAAGSGVKLLARGEKRDGKSSAHKSFAIRWRTRMSAPHKPFAITALVLGLFVRLSAPGSSQPTDRWNNSQMPIHYRTRSPDLSPCNCEV
jgi:hypothetical protein